MRSISILGSTGSVGVSCLKHLKNFKDEWQIHALVANENINLLIEQAKEFKPKYAVIGNYKYYEKLKESLAKTDIIAKSGFKSLIEITNYKVDIMLMAITGIAALKPLVSSIEAGSNIALANKESIVCGGNLILDLARKHSIKIIPVDSEHNAIFQIIENQHYKDIDKVYLTASGGPFRKVSKSDLETVTLSQALKHPTWRMGRKISIDSATMVNKSLEFIEAHYLFNLPPEKIDVIIHPESIIHAIVDFCDGNNFAVLNQPDMIIPISYALNYPIRICNNLNKIDFAKIKSLNFEEVDYEKFNSISIAKQCIKSNNKQVDCVVFNAANEVAVDNFLKNKIKFTDIVKIIEKTLNFPTNYKLTCINDIYDIDQYARITAEKILNDF